MNRLAICSLNWRASISFRVTMTIRILEMASPTPAMKWEAAPSSGSPVMPRAAIRIP
jgi:hypothetical protein